MSTQPAADDSSQAKKLAESAETLAFVPEAGTPSSPTGHERAPSSPTPASGELLHVQQTQDLVPAPPHHAETPVWSKVGALQRQSFDDIELLEEIGRGGMGLVYKGIQKSLNRPVAVKLLLDEHFRNPMALPRFQAEARAAACLDHTNIVQVYQVGECPFGHYFAMEYIDGLSLETLIQRGSLTVLSSVALLIVVAEAVHHAHTKGIIHRDLKPGNIMIDKSRRPVVMDFGIAKFVGNAASLTQQGVIMGTPAFMAPEQAGETPDPVGPQSDVYALGAILYNMLVGRPPYEAETALSTILKVIGSSMPAAPRSLNSQIPLSLDQVCMTCLDKKPAGRPASAQALALELRRIHAAMKKGETTLARRMSGSTMRTSYSALVLVASTTGAKLRVTQGTCILGRSAECDIVLRASDVSKRHCQIAFGDEGAAIEDLGSANGTFVNGQQVESSPLHDGDLVRIADHEFKVHLRQIS